jgi:hypothetical protein
MGQVQGDVVSRGGGGARCQMAWCASVFFVRLSNRR